MQRGVLLLQTEIIPSFSHSISLYCIYQYGLLYKEHDMTVCCNDKQVMDLQAGFCMITTVYFSLQTLR